MSKPSIAIGCDHAGYEIKIQLIAHLSSKGYEVKDFGTDSHDSVDYPDYVHPVANSVEKGDYRFGLLICGSANGVAMTANKHKDIRAAVCWGRELAYLARRHNDANIICLPSRFISLTMGKEMVDTFFNTDFEGGRHEHRVSKIPIVAE